MRRFVRFVQKNSFREIHPEKFVQKFKIFVQTDICEISREIR